MPCRILDVGNFVFGVVFLRDGLMSLAGGVRMEYTFGSDAVDLTGVVTEVGLTVL